MDSQSGLAGEVRGKGDCSLMCESYECILGFVRYRCNLRGLEESGALLT